MKRRAANANAFYPGSCSDIERMIERFNTVLESSVKHGEILRKRAKAIIAPHAGYIYSGFTANMAHRILGNAKPQRVVVIGPSHHLYFEGISASVMESYESPCGDLVIDREYIEKLAESFELLYAKEAHEREHSTETQIPFIRHYNPQAKVVELIYGRIDYERLVPIIEYILSDEKNAVVISTDLSHFHTLAQAERVDRVCLEGVARKDTKILENACEACGIIGMEAMVFVAQREDYGVEILDYRTSADASGDRERVVGYMSAIFTR